MRLCAQKGFTLIEIMAAVMILGIITVFSVLTFNAISRGWELSTEYMDKMQRTDYALNQLVSALRSMYYPHNGEQSYDYGFQLEDNGDGEDADSSDVISFSKTGTAIIGNRNAFADTVHRVQVMVLEEGSRDWGEAIMKTGLYARQCPDVALRPTNDDIDYTFANDEMYQPVLIADGVVGFNCRVLKDADQAKAKAGDEPKFEDEWDSSNSVPYKVELTFRVADPEGKSYRSNTAPVMRIVRIPVFEQSQDGAATPSDSEKDGAGRGRAGGSGNRGGSTTGGASSGGGKTPPGGGGTPAGGGRGPAGGAPGAGGGAPAGGGAR